MERMILDTIDLNILSTLARDCRTSYNSIGSQIGLTSKSVKARVKNMLRSGVIEKFVVRVNPAAFGYRTAIVLIRTSNGITKDDVIQRIKEFGDLAYHAHHVGSTSVAALIIKKPLDEKIIRSLNDRLKPATVARTHYRSVLERMYLEFQTNILYSPSVIEPENQLTFILFGENVFVVDYVLAKVNSFAGVKSADAYILTKLQYYDNWIMKEINKRLLLRTGLH